MAYQPFAPGFMTDLSGSLTDVRLRGVECDDCDVVLFGDRKRCENCASSELTSMTFSPHGTVYSYTIQRAPPTQPYKLGSTDADDWSPQPVSYIDLPEGARILSLLDGPLDSLSIGQDVELVVEPGWTTDDGTEVLIYRFTTEGP